MATGPKREQSMVCPLHWLHYSILISNFLHFSDRKSLSQFRQKMNVYGLVRPSPDPQDEPELTNRRRASETINQWEARKLWPCPSAGWGPGVSWLTLPQTTQTQFLMESGWCYVGNAVDNTNIISLTLRPRFNSQRAIFILETDPTRPTLLGH